MNYFEWIKKHQIQIEETFHYLHSIAEVSFQEIKTTKFICDELNKMDIPYTIFPDHTGVVATWRGNEVGPVVGIRADLDALWQNVNGTWKANHSCGHDAHATMVLYAIFMLKELGYIPNGTLKIIFQPAEETGKGARAFIEKGVIDDVNYLLGIHVRPVQELTLKQASPAIYHGATMILQGKVKGVQAHAARPHLGINVLDSIAAMIQAVNAVKMDPTISSSAKVTMVQTGGKSMNIIPDEAVFGIDLRAQTNDSMELLAEKVRQAVLSAIGFNGASVEFEKPVSMVAAKPDKWMEAVVHEAIEEVLGSEGTLPPMQTPGGEDFHYYTEYRPNLKATMIGLGANLTPGLHHPRMSFDLVALQDGIQIIANSLVKIFEKHKSNNNHSFVEPNR
ncbi:M20 peptidase aminoacylase family protein [Halalkalibacter kiskunsagensis]|uniref:M20 peptidase aminoacylase family protein n=1 Tax=Halalkalibacter kiskunsagensis TaxID=1548599 RepID=A0ABV6KJ69_9BACI